MEYLVGMRVAFLTHAIIAALYISPCFGAAPASTNASAPLPIYLSNDEILPPSIKTSLPPMPGPDALPSRPELPDVMTMNDGTKVTTKEQWAKRREEMKTILEYYAVGLAPAAPDNLKATVTQNQTLSNGTTFKLVHLTFGPKDKPNACFLDFGLWIPKSTKPVGVVIAQDGSPPGAPTLPRMPQGPNQGRGQDVFSASLAPLPASDPVPAPGGGVGTGSRGPEAALTNPVLAHGYAYVTYNSSDCAEDTTARFHDGSFAFRHTRFPAAYPDYDWGILRVWAWGASRIVDYLVTDPAFDQSQIAITGVSRNGKSSLVAGAFDERFTLVAPVASSGGGTPAFRFSGFEHGGNEGLSEMARKYPNWFSPHLHEFFHQAEKLPFDNHWYLALCAPRATICLEGTQDQNVNKYAVRQSYLAALPAFEFLGAKDHLQTNWANRPHGLVQGDWDGLMALADLCWHAKPTDYTFNDFPPQAMTPPRPNSASQSAPAAARATAPATQQERQ